MNKINSLISQKYKGFFAIISASFIQLVRIFSKIIII